MKKALAWAVLLFVLISALMLVSNFKETAERGFIPLLQAATLAQVDENASGYQTVAAVEASKASIMAVYGWAQSALFIVILVALAFFGLEVYRWIKEKIAEKTAKEEASK